MDTLLRLEVGATLPERREENTGAEKRQKALLDRSLPLPSFARPILHGL